MKPFLLLVAIVAIPVVILVMSISPEEREQSKRDYAEGVVLKQYREELYGAGDADKLCSYAKYMHAHYVETAGTTEQVEGWDRLQTIHCNFQK